MTTTQQANDVINGVAAKDDGIKRDQYGRYLLADPTTGEIKPWTRATTLANCLDDTTALETWKTRNLVFGIGRREDLFAMAASVATTSDAEDKKVLDTVIASADEAAAGPARANLGNALHGFTQRHDLGEKGIEVPSQWKADIDAYLAGMKVQGMWPYERFVERVLLVPEIETAGTVDRLLMGDEWELPKIGDLKTGKVNGKGRSFAIQLAIYAHATHWHDPKANTYYEMPKVNQELAIVIHLPVGAGECHFYEVDIAAGWEAALLAHDILQWRKRKDLSWPCSSMSQPPTQQDSGGADSATRDPSGASDAPPEQTDLPDDLLPARVAWLRGRVEAIIKAGQSKDLAQVWSESCADVPTFKAGGPRTHHEVDRVAGACNVVEMAHRLPFYDEIDPAKEMNINNNTIKELTKT